jgi:chromate transport protein ChrA
MNATSIYLAILIISGLAIVLDLVYGYNKKNKGISRMAGLAFAFVIAGIFLGGQQWMGYSLLLVGIILAIIDIIQKTKTKISS